MNVSAEVAPEFETRSRTVLARFGYAVLAPIVRVFMRFGWSARDFCELVRWVYVKEFYASPEFWRLGRPSAVQGAIKTGLSRVVVKQLNDIPAPEGVLMSYHQNLAYRVVEGWVKDAFFHENGKPIPLKITNPDGPSFRKLVSKYGNDVTHNAALGDLLAVNCVAYENGYVNLINQTYGINFMDEDGLEIAGYAIRRLGETIAHNLAQPTVSGRRVQRFWINTRIPASELDALMRRLEDEVIASGRRNDATMAEYEHAGRQEGIEYVEVGVGSYIFVDEDPENYDENREDNMTKGNKLK